MKITRIALLGLSFLFLACSAQAEIFMCKDASGKTISSDRPIPDCAGAVREYGANGQLRRTIAPPLTPEQKKQKQIEDEKEKAAAAAAAEQRRQDNAMLARYGNESDINAARKRALDQEQEQIKRETMSIADTETRLAAANKEAAPYTLKKAKVPAALAQKIEMAETSIRDSKQSIKDRQDQIDQINTKFDGTIKRFRELTAPPEKK